MLQINYDAFIWISNKEELHAFFTKKLIPECILINAIYI